MNDHNDLVLKEFLDEHFMYEIEGIIHSVETLAKYGRNADQSIINMCVDNFVSHGRNLLEFYYYPKKDKRGYARATHYVDSDEWGKIRPQKTDLIREFERRASNEMVHLTYKRISGNPPEKKWYFGPCLKDILVVTKRFLKILPDKYVGQKIVQLKESLSKIQ